MSIRYPVAGIGRLRMGNDGPGIRTLVIMNGCPLRCKYCINPFTWDGSKHPKMLSATELYEKIIIDRLYILATNGGITFGGGEPLLYPELVKEIRSICEPEMTIYLETSLNVEWENIKSVIDSVDCFYVDIKSMDGQIYKDYTEGNLDVSVTNLKKLIAAKGAEHIVVRIPEIPGFVSKEKQRQAKEILCDMGVIKFNLFKYETI